MALNWVASGELLNLSELVPHLEDGVKAPTSGWLWATDQPIIHSSGWTSCGGIWAEGSQRDVGGLATQDLGRAGTGTSN